MKKNNKGFTLVELLAALVILGVLAALALPTVVNLLGNSRDKLYITDAKKLISQAEYKFRVASSEIEKPEDGECLVLSMVYLDNSDFDNPPNNGEYVREASYVVVKNNGGNFEFSVELVEEVKKGVFKGVELSRDSSLSTSSTRHIVNFSKNDLYFVENNTVMGKYGGNLIDTSYINSKLGGSYVNDIGKVYNYPDLAESTYNANYSIPKITTVTYNSASNKNFNSLDTILKVVATDVDTPTKDLVVLVGPGHLAKYPDLNAPPCNASAPYEFRECKYEYGSSTDFTLKVDFADAGFTYNGATTSLYVLVVDPEGNTDRINKEYKIHTNEAPVIDSTKSGVFKRNSDNINLSTAVLRLNVSDDSTPVGDLKYCIVEGNKNATSCDGYRPYSEFVNSELSYTFECGKKNNCVYDGRELSLKVFLKDDDPTNSLETSAVFTYNLFRNDTPQIISVELESENLPFVTANSLALKANVKLNVQDSSSKNNLTVILDEDSSFEKQPVVYTYADFDNIVSYTFSGMYDGSEKTLFVKVTDEYGTSATYHQKYGNVHSNAKPVIEKIEIESGDLLTLVCPNSKICDKYENRGGAYEATVKVTASDDLVDEKDLKICISNVRSDCEGSKLNTNLLLYESGRIRHLDFTPSGTVKYDGSIKEIYIVVYDGYGVAADGTYNLSQFTDLNTANYQIYNNHEPEINTDELSIVSDNIDYNFRDVTVNFKVNDDLDSVNKLTYKIYDNAGGATVTGTIPTTSSDALNSVKYSFGGNYDGGTRILTIEVTDTYGAVAKETKEYNIHGNEEPKINYVRVETVESPCSSEACNNANSLKTKVRVSISDDLDTDFENSPICITTVQGQCNSYVTLKNYPGYTKENNGEYVVSYNLDSIDYPYKGNSINVYVYFKDSYGAIGSNYGSYILYNNNKAVIDNSYPIVQSSNYEETTVTAENEDGTTSTFTTNKNPNISKIDFKLKATDEFLDSKDLKYQVCYTKNMEDDITGSDVTCLENNKFYDYNPDANNVSNKEIDLGVTSYEGQEFFIFAKVYDDYALACYNGITDCPAGEDYIGYSSKTYYQVYQDIEPEITKYTVSRQAETTSYQTLDISFIVSDPLDIYEYCISESDSLCENYTNNSYDGSLVDNEISITYSPTWGSSEEPSSEFLIYLYIKDSHGNVVVKSTFTDRIPCQATFDNDGNLIDTGSIQKPIEFELKSGYEKLTASKCNNKCYYWEEYTNNGSLVPGSGNSDIKTYYNRTIKFVDKDDPVVSCNVDKIEYEAHCDFRDCYYNSAANNYNVTAIGYVTHDNSDASFTHTEGSETHIPDTYRLEYTTSYDEISGLINLYPTGKKICGKCFDEGKYNNVIVTYDNNDEVSG